MANSPEEKGSGWVKPVALAIGVAATAAWCGAEPVAEYLIGEPPAAPEAPVRPEKPKRVTATRGPIEVVVGFDITRSQIMGDLPSVVAATRRFFADTAALKPNDRVDVCTFAEEAECKSFEMPQDRAALDASIKAVQPIPKGVATGTHVHNAIGQMVAQVRGEAIVLAWTDGIDNDSSPKSPLAPGHPPVTIVVPRGEYVPSAQSVDRTLGDTGIDVTVARNSGEFGETLERFSSALGQRAQAMEQARSDADYRAKMGGYAAKMAEYEAALANNDRIKAEFAAARAAVEERIRSVKRTVKIVAGSLVAGLLLLIGWDHRERNKPRLRGFIVDKRTQFPETYRLPNSTEPKNFTALGVKLVLEPTKEGMKCNGKLIRHGDQIIPGVYYYERDPDIES